MEMYTNSAEIERRVFVPFGAVATSVDAFVLKDGEEVFEFATVAATPGGYQVTLPLFLNQHDADYTVRLVLTYTESANGEVYTLTKNVPVEVITPILSREEIRAIDSYVFETNAEADKIERAVRHVIQAYTGQEFGHYVGTQSVRGSGGDLLFSPRRIIELNSIDGLAAGASFVVDSEGYLVRYTPWGVPPVKADFHGLHMHTGGVIHNPYGVKWQKWNERLTYKLDGRFGWEEVPAPVKEAAKLLVNDYACADAQYRDRYLTSMTAADWRIQFHSGAFLRTGNVRADQLLSEYVVTRGWGVI